MSKLYESKLWLTRMYLVEKKSPQQIAESCKVNERTIRRWIEKFELKR